MKNLKEILQEIRVQLNKSSEKPSAKILEKIKDLSDGTYEVENGSIIITKKKDYYDVAFDTGILKDSITARVYKDAVLNVSSGGVLFGKSYPEKAQEFANKLFDKIGQIRK